MKLTKAQERVLRQCAEQQQKGEWVKVYAKDDRGYNVLKKHGLMKYVTRLIAPDTTQGVFVVTEAGMNWIVENPIKVGG